MSLQIHSRSVANIPFSWENKPGISKSTARQQTGGGGGGGGTSTGLISLPPPPCPPEKRAARASFHGLQVPLPPCAFMSVQARKGVNSKKGVNKKVEDEDDPFLVAYIECRKSGSFKAKGDVFGLWKKKNNKNKNNNTMFSCKKSCSVRDDSIVRMSQLLPVSRSRRGDQ